MSVAKLPKRLDPDPIAEALLEIRFVSGEIPELVVGRFAQFGTSRGFTAHRVATADIPAAIREVNPDLRYSPVLELRNAEGSRTIRVGPNAVSFHATAPYPGWAAFRTELWAMIDFSAHLTSYVAERIGLRYVNAFTEAKHGIRSARDLNFELQVAGAPLLDPVNVNYRRALSSDHRAQVRLASREFVNGPAAETLSALIDVDVATPPEFRTEDHETIKTWTNTAHDLLKIEFFGLLDDDTKSRLKATGGRNVRT